MFSKNPVVIKSFKYGSKDKTGEIEKNVLVQLNKKSVLPKLLGIGIGPNPKFVFITIYNYNALNINAKISI